MTKKFIKIQIECLIKPNESLSVESKYSKKALLLYLIVDFKWHVTSVSLLLCLPPGASFKNTDTLGCLLLSDCIKDLFKK